MRAHPIACLLAAALTACHGGADTPRGNASGDAATTAAVQAPAPTPATPEDATRKEAAMTDPGPPSGLPLPTCEEVQASGASESARADKFYARYPKALAGTDSVETVALTAGEVDDVVQYLVCAADATDFDPVVAENGVALFASRRHGRAALARLAALRREGDPSARQFGEQIDGYLKGPGE